MILSLLRIGLVFSASSLLTLITITRSTGQVVADAEFLRNLIDTTSPVGEIVVFQMDGFSQTIFWPKDLEGPEQGVNRPDYLVRNSSGLYSLIEGTGRVYQITRSGDSITYRRKDLSRFVGNNFQQMTFSYRDTIYALGGYGFWRWNGLLKAFNEKTLTWDIVPLNKELVVRQHFNSPRGGYWMDYNHGLLYYLTKPYDKEWQKNHLMPISFLSDTTSVHRLDLNAKSWTRLGIVSRSALEKLSNAQRYGATPFGELIATLPLPEKRIFAIDYTSNQILELKKEKAHLISEFLHGENTPKGKIISYWSDSTLHFRTIKGLKLDVYLHATDFLPTGSTVYKADPLPFLSLTSIMFVLVGTTSIGLGLIYIKKYRRTSESKTSEIRFDPVDQRIIDTILQKSDFVITASEINDLLGTGTKSDDAQRKTRSEFLKRINSTWTQLSGMETKLISPYRMESDRRMVLYILDQEKYNHYLKSAAKK